MAKKIPEEIANRLFTNMFICMKCGGKMKAPPSKVSERKIKCRKCGSKQLRKKAKERRGLGA